MLEFLHGVKHDQYLYFNTVFYFIRQGRQVKCIGKKLTAITPGTLLYGTKNDTEALKHFTISVIFI